MGPEINSSFDIFSVVSIIFPILFIIAFIGIFINILRGVKQWNFNNKQPELTVPAKIVSKRTETHHHQHNQNNQVAIQTTTSYFVTFEVESGDRIEFKIQGHQYGQMIEGDNGKLTFQGTRFIGFERGR
jgi:hypothetical protein